MWNEPATEAGAAREEGAGDGMSYCRWSSDRFRCDVYVYEDVSGGWTTHVAGRRVVIPDCRPSGAWLLRKPEWLWGFLWRFGYRVLPGPMWRYDIASPLAGQSFNDDTPGECADRLLALRTAGFRVPQYAIDNLRAESAPGGRGQGGGQRARVSRPQDHGEGHRASAGATVTTPPSPAPEPEPIVAFDALLNWLQREDWFRQMPLAAEHQLRFGFAKITDPLLAALAKLTAEREALAALVREHPYKLDATEQRCPTCVAIGSLRSLLRATDAAQEGGGRG